MPNIIAEAFSSYCGSIERFRAFHNQVINMPRDAFSTAKLEKLQKLASYLLLIESDSGRMVDGYKKVMESIINELNEGKVPDLRDSDLEHRYFNSCDDIETLYEVQGRMFRHLMGLCVFFGLIKSHGRRDKRIEFDTCRELVLSDKNMLVPIFRNNLLNINVNSNGYIKMLSGITLRPDADFRPAYGIIKYIYEINRPISIFEASVLLGRIDEVQQEYDILKRALSVGRMLPQNQDEQIKMFFGSLGWKNSQGRLFEYARSQEPYFKFRTFILYMGHFDLVDINVESNTLTLTKYAKELLAEEIPIEIADLHTLLSRIDDDSESDNVLADIIIRKRSAVITNAIKNDSELISKMNLRALRSPEVDRHGKRKRNRIIAELAKIREDYTCEVTGQKTFKMANGSYYVESHHIIEFSKYNGPDITDNLIVLGPEKHKLIHYACADEIEDLLNHLKTNGKLSFQRFEKIHNDYRCLTAEHVKFLYDKKLISRSDRERLLHLVGTSANC